MTQALAPHNVDLPKVVALLKGSRQQKKTYQRSVKIALFVNMTENCGTEDIMVALRLGGARNWRPGGSVAYAMSTTKQLLSRLENMGLLVKELVAVYVPAFSVKYGVGNLMGGRHMKEGKAIWRVHPDLLIEVEK